MSDERESAEHLALLVAEGTPVDWDEALRGATTDEERRIIRQLQLVESVARVHGSDESESSATRPSPAVSNRTADAASVEHEPAIGNWGHLELREKLGEGSFGEVYRAWDPQLEREVALKLIKPRESAEKARDSKVVEEGRLLAKLRHPHVVTVYGADIHDGRIGLWMEFVRGRSLEQLLHDQGPFGAREAALIGVDLCRALAAVHRAGVVHRDVKAQNAMREAGGRIVLMDFGAGIETSPDRGEPGRKMTGTPFYMAPELFRGEPATRRSDIYALGVLLYRLATGKFPLEASSWSEIKRRLDQGETRLLRDERPDLPEGFVAAIERAMALDPTARFATAGQMEQALSLAIGAGATAPADIAPLPRAGGASAHHRMTLMIGIVIAAAAIGSLLMFRSMTKRPVVVTSDATSSAGAPATTAPARTQASYTVHAAVYRVAPGSDARERIEPGDRLALGDRLTLEFQASAPLHVYIVDEDEAGHSFALFPLPGLDEQNPLSPGVTHVLPGSRAGKNLSWTVDTPGGEEHLLVLASPKRLTEYEAAMRDLARPGQMAVSIPEAAKIHLRGIGSLSETPTAGGTRSAAHLFDMAQRLASRSEVVEGIWMRRIDLENPRR